MGIDWGWCRWIEWALIKYRRRFPWPCRYINRTLCFVCFSLIKKSKINHFNCLFLFLLPSCLLSVDLTWVVCLFAACRGVGVIATTIATFLRSVDASSGVIGGHHPSAHALSYILSPHSLHNNTIGGSGGQSLEYGGFTEENFEGESKLFFNSNRVAVQSLLEHLLGSISEPWEFLIQIMDNYY
jgi:hypothetical protein